MDVINALFDIALALADAIDVGLRQSGLLVMIGLLLLWNYFTKRRR